MSELSDHIRKSFKESDDVRDAGLETPEGVERFDDIAYGPESNWQRLDLYRPEGAAAPLPVIMSVHGGAWVYGDKERYQFYCLDLAKRGFAVVNFTYRLAPEFKFPAPLEDISLVADWTLRHAEEYGLDRENIFAVGDSAGAHLLALYASALANPACAGHFDLAIPSGFSLKACALNCGVYDLSAENEFDPDRPQIMKDFLEGGGTDEEIFNISPVNFITKKFPPVFLATCTGDFLKGQAPIILEKFVENDVPCEFHFFTGKNSGELGHVFHLRIKTDDAELCNDMECDFFRSLIS